MILIDNYDSFTYNIVRYLEEIGVQPRVYKNDEITIEELKKMSFTHLIISPGPGNPIDRHWFGVCDDVMKTFYKTKKILGICLGHQLIAHHFGAQVVKDQNPHHGKVSSVHILQPSKLFDAISNNFEAARYHSLKVDTDSLPETLIQLAKTHDNILMALKHKEHEVYGVQFHPEAILTQHGHQLLQNFANL